MGTREVIYANEDQRQAAIAEAVAAGERVIEDGTRQVCTGGKQPVVEFDKQGNAVVVSPSEPTWGDEHYLKLADADYVEPVPVKSALVLIAEKLVDLESRVSALEP